jgi:hypothetical protein
MPADSANLVAATFAWLCGPGSVTRAASLQEPGAGVSLEQVAAPYVAPQCVHRAMARHLDHLERIGAGFGGADQKPARSEWPAALVAPADQRGGADGEHPRDEVGGAVPRVWRMPRSTSRTAGLAGSAGHTRGRRVMVDARRPASASAAR